MVLLQPQDSVFPVSKFVELTSVYFPQSHLHNHVKYVFFLPIFYIFHFNISILGDIIDQDLHPSLFITDHYISAFIFWLCIIAGYVLIKFVLTELQSKNFKYSNRFNLTKFIVVPVSLFYIFIVSFLVHMFGNVHIFTYMVIFGNIFVNWIISLGFLAVNSSFLYPMYFLLQLITYITYYNPNHLSN